MTNNYEKWFYPAVDTYCPSPCYRKVAYTREIEPMTPAEKAACAVLKYEGHKEGVEVLEKLKARKRKHDEWI